MSYQPASTPITVVDKTLRTGQRLVLTYGPDGYTAVVDGQEVCSGFSTYVRRNAVALADTPHVFEVPKIPGVVKERGRFGIPVGLTDAEADAVDGAQQEYEQAPVRRARASAPDAPTWTTRWYAWRPPVGTTYEDADGRVVTVLDHIAHWVEDGPSFGLDSQEGYVYEQVVRAATAEEVEALVVGKVDRLR